MSTTQGTSTLTGVWKNGQIVLDGLADWPEGCRVIVEPIADQLGITEEEWPRTPEAMASWLEWFDSVEPIEMTAEDEAGWQDWRQKVKDYTIAKMNEQVEGLFE
jgi:hypothetical protein